MEVAQIEEKKKKRRSGKESEKWQSKVMQGLDRTSHRQNYQAAEFFPDEPCALANPHNPLHAACSVSTRQLHVHRGTLYPLGCPLLGVIPYQTTEAILNCPSFCQQPHKQQHTIPYTPSRHQYLPTSSHNRTSGRSSTPIIILPPSTITTTT